MKQVITFIFMFALSSLTFAQENNFILKDKKTGSACATPDLERGKEDANLTRGKDADELTRGKNSASLNKGNDDCLLERGKQNAGLKRGKQDDELARGTDGPLLKRGKQETEEPPSLPRQSDSICRHETAK